MKQELAFELANNTTEWLALSRSISAAEKVSFGNIHDRFFTKYGPNFMAYVCRTAIEEVRPSLPGAACSQLLNVFQQALDEAINGQTYALPTAADCSVCHARKF